MLHLTINLNVKPIFSCLPFASFCSLQQVLLQPEEELLEKQSELVSETATVKSKPTYGKMKVQGAFLFLF